MGKISANFFFFTGSVVCGKKLFALTEPTEKTLQLRSLLDAVYSHQSFLKELTGKTTFHERRRSMFSPARMFRLQCCERESESGAWSFPVPEAPHSFSTSCSSPNISVLGATDFHASLEDFSSETFSCAFRKDLQCRALCCLLLIQ
jgi:hypothetical protein